MSGPGLSTLLRRTISKLKTLYSKSLAIRRLLVKPLHLLLIRPGNEIAFRRVAALDDVWRAKEVGADSEEVKVYAAALRSLLTPQEGVRIAFASVPQAADCQRFVAAAQFLDLDHKIFSLEDSEFIDKVNAYAPTVCFVRPLHDSANQRLLHQEKIEILSTYPEIRLYPSLAETRIYEAKRTLSYYLRRHNIPHPATRVFLNLHDAMGFLGHSSYPLVFKTSTGAGGSGVEIVRDRRQAERLARIFFNRHYLSKTVLDYRAIDYGYLIVQEFIPNVREYRVIKIGQSWFGHEKARRAGHELMSGSGRNEWTVPRDAVFEFCFEIAAVQQFTTMAFDVFEDVNGNLYVNELQTWFGSFNPSQMYVNGVPGRYFRNDDQQSWHFEEGMFNPFGSMALRIIDSLNTTAN